jgi:hypothetical protein
VGNNSITKHNGAAYVGAANTEVATINPFEAFFVQVPNSTPINFAVAGRQSIKSEIGTNLSDKLELTAFTSTGKDKTNLIMDDIQTAQYEIGYDLEKWVVTGTGNPQIYSILGGINYAYNTLPFSSLQNLPIGIYSKTKSTVTINANLINSSSISQLFLNDNVTGSVTDLLNSSYTFTCEAGTFNSRFNLSVKRILTDVLNQKSTTDKVEPNLIIRNYTISIDNINNESSIKIFDTTGRVLVSRKSVLGSVNIILDQKGMYVVEIITKTDRWIKKVACN